jgi:hypothetical protein
MAGAPAGRRRWDTDERFTGVADASGFAAAADELAALARRPGWVAEEPEAHLVPHLTSARTGLEVLDCAAGADGALDVTARPAAGAGQRDVRREAWALLGAIAEPAAIVRERRDGDAVVFEVITGVPDGAAFASHGHTVRLRICPRPCPSRAG